MKKRKFGIALIILFLIACAVLYIIIYTVPEITGSRVETVIAEYGQIRVTEDVSAIVIREEIVINSEQSGNVNYYIANNTKTRKGIQVLSIYNNGTATNVLCPKTGVISYYYDGYESLLTPDNLIDAQSFIPDEGTIDVQFIQTDSIKKNQPLYKLITSDTWYIVCLVPNENTDKYTWGNSVSIEFETGSVSGKIANIYPGDEYASVVISTSKYFADYDKLRQCDVTIVLSDSKGLIVPNTAITTIDEQTGVYVKNISGDYIFTNVKVKADNGTNSVVYADTYTVLYEDGLTDTISTISIYDEILKDASGYNQEN